MIVEDKTYYEDEQKLEANWVLIFILFSTISTLVITVWLLYESKTEWLAIGMVAGAILFSDILIIFIFRTMKLELALTKKGMYYKMSPFAKNHFIDWNEVAAISLRKSPVNGYGKHKKWKYGDVYTMNRKMGVELILKTGKKKFFSLKDPDEFKKGFRRLEVYLQIE